MKLNLLKKLLTLTPVVISPILVTACGNSDGDKLNDINAAGQFYLDFYQRELNAVWATKTADINAAAAKAEHQYDLQLQVLSEVLTKVKADGASEFKKEFPKLDNYDPSNFSDINVSFTIPDDSKGNLKVDDGKLTIYPYSVIGSNKRIEQINYTLKLNSPKEVGKELSGDLKFNLQPGFINYDTNTLNKLANDDVAAVYGNPNMSTILVGTYGGGLDVGTRQSAGGYKFDNYNASGSGDKKILNNYVTGVYGNADLSTILVGTDDGLDVGTRQADRTYKFGKYTTSNGLADNAVQTISGNKDLSTILVGEYGGGMDVGTRDKASDAYTFKNYSTSSPGKEKLVGNKITGVYGNDDLSEILVGSYESGLSVGKKLSGGNYNFDNYTTSGSGKQKLANIHVSSVSGNADLSTILVGEEGGGLDVGTKNGSSYEFTNYNNSGAGSSKLSDNEVQSVYGSTDLSKILVGELTGGLDVGTKESDGGYSFKNYTTANGLANNTIWATFGNANLSSILLGEDRDGIDISSNLWFA